MMGITHAATGALVGLAIGGPVGAATGALGALLPDVDHPKSMAGRRAWLLGGALRLVVSHRGVLHSGLVAALLVLAALVADQTAVLACAAGWVSHIALDMLNRAGVPLLWPSRRRYWILPLRTGGMVDRLILLAVLVLLVRMVVG